MNPRKEAIRAYKEQKTARGVFAVRCKPTGSVWVDSAMDLRAAENRTWASLRLADVHAEPILVSEFREHGRDAFTFEVLEKLDDDVAAMSLRDLLKKKKLHWLGQLSARKLSPG